MHCWRWRIVCLFVIYWFEQVEVLAAIQLMWTCYTHPSIYSQRTPHPRRLESLTISGCIYKGSTFSSVIYLFKDPRARVEITTSRMGARCSTNWATAHRCAVLKLYIDQVTQYGFKAYFWRTKAKTHHQTQLRPLKINKIRKNQHSLLMEHYSVKCARNYRF